jgi:hypothetical protein
VLRFYMHESQDEDGDRRKLDALIALIGEHPGEDVVRLFIHAADGDRIELSMPTANASEELRTAGITLLGEGGGAEELARPSQTAGRPAPGGNGASRSYGVQPLEV